MSAIEKSTLTFLAELAKHNDRDWFNARKDRYLDARANLLGFVEDLLVRMRKHDRIATENGKEALMSIYSDQRFHKDRPPYKPRFAGGIARVKPALRGGYFFHFQPGRSLLACGFHAPEPADLKRIRMDILYDHPTWKKVLGRAAIRSTFGELQGEQVLTVPRGFPADHPAIDLLRRKQFVLRHPLTDKEVRSPDLAQRMDSIYRSVRPFFDHMSTVLTSDENGDPLS